LLLVLLVLADTRRVLLPLRFVIKTVDDKGGKVFINICGSDKVAPPGARWVDGQVPEEVQRALDQGNEADEAAQQALRCPISLGEPRVDMDRKGEACTVFDCVFNDEVASTASKGHRQLKNFIIELALGWIQHKVGRATSHAEGGGVLFRAAFTFLYTISLLSHSLLHTGSHTHSCSGKFCARQTHTYIMYSTCHTFRHSHFHSETPETQTHMQSHIFPLPTHTHTFTPPHCLTHPHTQTRTRARARTHTHTPEQRQTQTQNMFKRIY
jgi:hypothetical protein